MKRIVLDTSVVVKWFSEEEGRELALDYLRQLQEGEVEIFLPELAKYELANALLKGKGLPFRLVDKVLGVFYSLPLNFVAENLQLAKESYQLAEKAGITYYDASFLSLAKDMNAALITANPRHQRKIRGIEIKML